MTGRLTVAVLLLGSCGGIPVDQAGRSPEQFVAGWWKLVESGDVAQASEALVPVAAESALEQRLQMAWRSESLPVILQDFRSQGWQFQGADETVRISGSELVRVRYRLGTPGGNSMTKYAFLRRIEGLWRVVSGFAGEPSLPAR